MARLRMTIDTVLTPFERNSVMTIHREKDVYEQLCPTNSKLTRDFLLYISINNYTYQSCTAMKASLFKFLKWNLIFNEDCSFYSLKRSHFTKFFSYLHTEENLSYDRIRIIKSHLSTLSDFCEHILGHEEYIFTNKVVHNKWFYFTNIVKYVPLPFEGEPKKAIPSNINDFDEQDINRLKWYLIETKDYESYVVLYFAHLGVDILDLTIDDVIEQGDENCKKWVRYLERYGLPFKQVILVQFERNAWRVATQEDLCRYEGFFSSFLGKKFVVCNDYRY